MFKYIMAFAFPTIVGVLLAATMANAQVSEYEACEAGAGIAEATAKIRDQGATDRDAYFTLMSAGLGSELARNFVVFVYHLNREDNPTEIYAEFMNMCLGEST
jgi:hypothetical protein